MKAIEVVFEFFISLVKGNYEKALSRVSKTWSAEHDLDEFKAILSVVPDSFQVQKVDQGRTDATAVVKVVKEGKSSLVTVKLVCETWPGKMDPSGDWGVIPESAKVTASKYKKDAEEEERLKAEQERIKADEKAKADFEAEKELLKEQKAKEEADAQALKALIAEAEDLGIELPEGAEKEEIEKLIEQEKSK